MKKSARNLDMSDLATMAAQVSHGEVGTAERHAKDSMEVGGHNHGIAVAKVRDPLRIDKLLRRGMIDHMQHMYALQIIVLHTIVHKSDFSFSAYTDQDLRYHSNESMLADRINARDQYYRTLTHLSREVSGIVHLICFDELSATDTCFRLGINPDNASNVIPAAFDALGEALMEARDYFEKRLTAPE